MKDLDTLKEPAAKIAKRKWRNNDIRKKILAERNLPKRDDPTEKERQTEIAKVVTNAERLGSKVKRFESKFKREIREMMESKANQNLAIYADFLERRKIKLLREKLKRLKAKEEAEKNKPVERDVFGFPIERHTDGG